MKVKMTIRSGEKVLFDQLIEKGVYVIGRAKDSDFMVDEDGISRKHLQIEIDDLGCKVFLTDLGSSNGTRTGSQKLAANVREEFKAFYQSIDLSYNVRIFLEVEMDLS